MEVLSWTGLGFGVAVLGLAKILGVNLSQAFSANLERSKKKTILLFLSVVLILGPNRLFYFWLTVNRTEPSLFRACVGVAIALIYAAGEEILFRFWLLHLLQKKLRFSLAVLISVIIFAIGHGFHEFPIHLITAVNFFVLFFASGSLLLPTLVHGMGNFLADYYFVEDSALAHADSATLGFFSLNVCSWLAASVAIWILFRRDLSKERYSELAQRFMRSFFSSIE